MTLRAALLRSVFTSWVALDCSPLPQVLQELSAGSSCSSVHTGASRVHLFIAISAPVTGIEAADRHNALPTNAKGIENNHSFTIASQVYQRDTPAPGLKVFSHRDFSPENY